MSFRQLSLRRSYVAAAAALFVVSYVAQLNYDAWLRYSPPKVSTTYNIYIEPQPLNSNTAKQVSFGAREFLANVYWLELIQYYGGGDPNGKYRKLAELFNLVTDLSPKFEEAYQTGLIILPGEGFTDEALALGKKGEQNLPDSWEMPYYTGLVYHIYKKDYSAAAKEFDIAATKPGAPAITQYFSALYYSKADQRQIAYQIFKTVEQTTKEDYVRDRAKLQRENLETIFFLEDAANKYKDRYGHYPSTLNDLVTGKILSAIPPSPLNIDYIIDPQTGHVSEGKSLQK